MLFGWQCSLGEHSMNYAANLLRMEPTSVGAKKTDSKVFNENRVLFYFLIARISKTTVKGRNLIAELQDALTDGDLPFQDGHGLAEYLQEYAQYKDQGEIQEVLESLTKFRWTLQHTDDAVKLTCTVMRRTYFRLPKSCRGAPIAPFYMMINALPEGAEIEKAQLMQEIGMTGLSVYKREPAVPKWAQFSCALQATLRAARKRQKTPLSSIPALPILPSKPEAEAMPEALATFAKPGTKPGGGGSGGKCWHCASTEHLAKDCDKDRCGLCGKRFCGALRGLPCMVKNGVPEGARGVDGQPLDKKMIARIKGCKPLESGGQSASGGRPAPSSNATVLDQPSDRRVTFDEIIDDSHSDPLQEATGLLEELYAISAVTEFFPPSAVPECALDEYLALDRRDAFGYGLIVEASPTALTTSALLDSSLCWPPSQLHRTPELSIREEQGYRYLEFVIDGASNVNVIRDVARFPRSALTLFDQPMAISGIATPSEGDAPAAGISAIGYITATIIFPGSSPDVQPVSHRFRKMLAAPDARYNLLSEGDIWDDCRGLVTKGNTMTLELPMGTARIRRSESTLLYMITGSIANEPEPTALVADVHDAQRNVLVWHSRMGLTPASARFVKSHNVGMHGIAEDGDAIKGVDVLGSCTIDASVLKDCYVRDLSQMRAANGPYSSSPEHRSKAVAAIRSLDGFGPHATPGYGGHDYLMFDTDDFSGLTFAETTHLHTAKVWLAFVDVNTAFYKSFGHASACIRTDGAGEFENETVWNTGLQKRLFVKQQNAPHEKGGNGVVERAIGVHTPWGRHFMLRVGANSSLFLDAVVFAVYTSRFKESPRHPGMTRWEVATGTKGDVSRLRIWGCRTYSLVDTDVRGGKHAPVSRKGIFVGIHPFTGNYIVQCEDGRRYSVRNNIKFYELEHAYKGVPSSSITVDTGTQTDEGDSSAEVPAVNLSATGIGSLVEPDAPRPIEQAQAQYNAGLFPSGGPRPDGGTFELRKRQKPGEPLALALMTLVSADSSILTREIYGALGLAPGPSPLCMVASTSGQNVRLMGPQGEYFLMHPKNYAHSQTLPQAEEWKNLWIQHHAYLHDPTATGTPTLRTCPRVEAERTGEKIHRGQEEYKIKIKADDGSLDKLKVRYCFDGRNWLGVLIDTAVGSLNGGLLNAMLALTAIQDRELAKADVPDAYLKGQWPKGANGSAPRRVFMEQMSNFRTYTDGVLDVDEVMLPLWGAPPSGQLFNMCVVKAFKELGAIQCPVAAPLWRIDQGDHNCLIGIQVDDFLLSATKGAHDLLLYIKGGVERILKCKLKWELEPTEIVSIRIDRHRPTNRLQTSIQTYILAQTARFAPDLIGTLPNRDAVPARNVELLQAVKPFLIDGKPPKKLTKEQKACQEETGVLVYISGQRFETKLEVHVLSRVMYSPDPASQRALKDSLWVYLYSTVTWGPTYGGPQVTGQVELKLYERKRELFMDDGSSPDGELEICSDATFPNETDVERHGSKVYAQKPLGSGIHMFARAAISANVNVINARMTSTTHSEQYETTQNMYIGQWYRPLLGFMGCPQTMPTKVYGDNSPNETMSNGGSIGQSRHIAARIKWQQEQVEAKEFAFDRVDDANNPADCIGKWVPPKKKRQSTSFTFNQRNAVRPLYL